MQDSRSPDAEFTAGARRALVEAAHWSLGAACDELDAVAILLGLAAESECRAAAMLAQRGITAEAIRRHWPKLAKRDTTAKGDGERPGDDPIPPLRRRLADDVRAAMETAATWLAQRGQPPELATEHILLGLAFAKCEVGDWLRQRGLGPEVLEEDLARLHGHLPNLDSLESLDPPEELAADIDQTLSPPPPSYFSGMLPPEPTGTATAVDEIHVLRVIDAATNRAREGLRVVEDFVRFVLDDRHLTEQLKRLRHDLTAALKGISLEHRLGARETRFDVGTGLATAEERERGDVAAVLAANFIRLQESLRTLEEFGKLLDADLAAAIEQLRYRSYTLHRAVEITRASHERLAQSRLYVLIDGQRTIEDFDLLARDLVLAGVDAMQLRDKQLGDRELLDRARLLRQLTLDSHTLFIVNDRADLAVLARADGVHVGQEELSVKDVRSIVGPRRLIGVSVHSIEQARAAVLDGANYVGVGPTFPSETKHFDAYPGLDLLRAVSAEIRLPAFAIGGITEGNLSEVLATGMRRVAVTGAVIQAANPAAAALELLRALRG